MEERERKRFESSERRVEKERREERADKDKERERVNREGERVETKREGDKVRAENTSTDREREHKVESEKREKSKSNRTEFQGRVRGRSKRAEQRVEVETEQREEVAGRVRGRGRTTQNTTGRGRRRVTVERVSVDKLPGRKDPFWKEFYGGEKKRKLCGKNNGQAGNTELGGMGENRSSKMDGGWLEGGVLVGGTTRVGGEEVSKCTNDRGTKRVCGQSVGGVEGSGSIRRGSGEVCVWNESGKEEGAKEVEIVYQQQASQQKGDKVEGQVRRDRSGERVDENVWVGDPVGSGEWVPSCDVQRGFQGVDGSRVERRGVEVCQDAFWVHQCSRTFHTSNQRNTKAFKRNRNSSDIMDRRWLDSSQNQGGVTLHQGSNSQAKIREVGMEDQLGQVTMGSSKIDQVYRLLAELRGEGYTNSRRQIGEVERSDVESYQGIRENRRNQAEKSGKGDGSVGECERGLGPSHGVFQGWVQNFTTRQVEGGNMGDKGGARSTTSRGLDFSDKAISSGGQATNTTDRESDRGVVRCFSNRLGLCTSGARGKRLVGRRGKRVVNKQKGAVGVLERASELRERSEREGVKMGGRQHNFNHLVLEGSQGCLSGTAGETNVDMASREGSQHGGAKMGEVRGYEDGCTKQMGGQGRLGGGRLGVSTSRGEVGTTQHRQVCRREEQQVQEVEQQVLVNRRRSSRCLHTRLDKGQQLVGATPEGDPQGSDVPRGTKRKRDNSGATVETVVVASGNEDGNRLGGIRPKRARNISERGKWFSGTLTQQVLGLGVSESEVKEGLKEVESFLGMAFAPGTLSLYGGEWKKFVEFCERVGMSSLPATPFTVARFMAFRFREGAEGTKGTISAAISAVHQAAGFPSPVHNKVVEWVKRGIEKCRKRREKTKPFEIEWLRKWRVGGWKKYGVSEWRWLRDSAIIALGIRMIQRPDDLSNLNVGDVEFGKGAMWVKIRSSKADQEGVGHVVPIDATDDMDMCVVAIVGEYLSVRKGKSEDPLFTNLSNLWKRLSAGGVSKAVSFVAKKVNGENKGVSGRSLRVAGATLGVAAGIPAEILKTVANWKSDAIWEYVRAAGASSMRISELMGFGTTLPPSLGSSEGKRKREDK